MSKNSGRSIRLIVMALVLSSLLALAGSVTGASVAGIPVFALCVLVAFAIQWIAFVPAYLLQTEHFYDLTGSLTYLIVVASALVLADVSDPRALLIAAMVAVWATRLGSFLFVRISKDGSDTRFDKIKPSALRFFAAWTVQGLWVSMTVSCGLVAICAGGETPLGIVGIIGALIWLCGFLIEVIADYQKRVFRKRMAGKKGFIQEGLWAYSRHPNYFGEIVLWVGVAVTAFPALSGWQYVTLVSPVFVTLLLTRMSGIPMLEASADKRWQDNAAYQHYKKQTPVLVPRLTRPELMQGDAQ